MMRFETVAEFVAMGGHGPFVWSAYGIAVVVIAFNFVWPIIMERRNRALLREQMLAKSEGKP